MFGQFVFDREISEKLFQQCGYKIHYDLDKTIEIIISKLNPGSHRLVKHFYALPTALKEMKSFKLGCIKTKTPPVRCFFLIHGNRIIAFPAFEVPPNAHEWYMHNATLDKMLTDEIINDLKKLSPISDVEPEKDDGLADNKQIELSRHAEKIEILAEIQARSQNVPAHFSLRLLRQYCADMATLTQLKLQSSITEKAERAYSILLTRLFDLIDKSCGYGYLLNCLGNVELCYYSGQQDKIVLSLGKMTSILAEKLREKQQSDLTQKQQQFLLLSLSLDCEFFYDQIKKHLPRTAKFTNQLILSALDGLKQGGIHYTDFEKLICFLNEKDCLKLILREHIVSSIYALTGLWQQQTIVIDKEKAMLLAELLLYCNEDDIKQIFDNNHFIMTESMLLFFLENIKSFAYARLQIACKWLESRFKFDKLAISPDVVTQIKQLFHSLDVIEQELFRDSLAKRELLQHEVIADCFQMAPVIAKKQNNYAQKKQGKSSRGQEKADIHTQKSKVQDAAILPKQQFKELWSKLSELQKQKKAINEISDPVFSVLRELLLLVKRYREEQVTKTYLQAIEDHVLKKTVFNSARMPMNHKVQQSYAARNKLNMIELSAVCGRLDLLKLLVDIFGCEKLKPYTNDALLYACYYLHIPIVRVLLQWFSCDPNRQDEAKRTSLHLGLLDKERVSHELSAELIAILIDAGADINSALDTGATPSTIAIMHYNILALTLLLARGADPKRGISMGEGDFYYSLRDVIAGVKPTKQNKEAAKNFGNLLEKYKVDYVGGPIIVANANTTIKKQIAPLTEKVALREGNVYSSGASMVSAKSYVNHTLPERSQDVKHYFNLIERYAKAFYFLKENQLGSVASASPVKAELASAENSILAFLRTNRQFINANPASNLPFLFFAIFNSDNNIALLKTLLAEFPDIWLGQRKVIPLNDASEVLTPLHFAIRYGSYQAVALLLQYNAPLSIPDSAGYLPIHVAVQQNKLDMVELLYNHGANFHDYTSDGLTALHIAVDQGAKDCFDFLAGKDDIDVNFKSQQGYTPLQHAISIFRYSMLAPLLKNGAHIQDAIELAIERQDTFVANTLYQYFIMKESLPEIPQDLRLWEFFSCAQDADKDKLLKAYATLFEDYANNTTLAQVSQLNRLIAGETIFHLLARTGRFSFLELFISHLKECYGEEVFKSHINLSLPNAQGEQVKDILQAKYDERVEQIERRLTQGQRAPISGMSVVGGTAAEKLARIKAKSAGKAPIDDLHSLVQWQNAIKTIIAVVEENSHYEGNNTWAWAQKEQAQLTSLDSDLQNRGSIDQPYKQSGSSSVPSSSGSLSNNASSTSTVLMTTVGIGAALLAAVGIFSTFLQSPSAEEEIEEISICNMQQ